MHLFVGHVFSREQIDDFRHALASGIQLVGASLWFADQHPGTGHIFDKIKAGIDNSFACLFEVSDTSRANVFLELGYAFGRGKQCILVSKVGSPVASDLAGLERIEYTSYKDLTGQLSNIIGELLSRANRGRQVDKRVVRALAEKIEPDGLEIEVFLTNLSSQGVTRDESHESLLALKSFGLIELSNSRLTVTDAKVLRSWLPLT